MEDSPYNSVDGECSSQDEEEEAKGPSVHLVCCITSGCSLCCSLCCLLFGFLGVAIIVWRGMNALGTVILIAAASFLLIVICLYGMLTFEREGGHFNCCNYYFPLAQQFLMAFKGDSGAWYESLTKEDPYVGHGPGPKTVMYYGWEDVVSIFKDWAPRIENDTMKRHNELGLTHFHSAPWSELGSIGTSVSHQEHAISRPFIWRVADGANMPETSWCDGSQGWNRSWLRSVFRERFSQLDEFKPSIIQEWVARLFHKIHLNMDVTDKEAKDFTGLKKGASIYSAFPPRAQGCPFFGSISGVNAYNQKREKKVAAFKDALQAKFPREEWDDDKLAIVANVFCDSMLFAGGLSVVSTIETMLALWFMEDRPSGVAAVNPQDEGSLQEFLLETTRRYAPVAGVPRWITDDDGHTWEHEICNLRMANRDKRKFPHPLSFTPGRPGLNQKDDSLSCAWAEQLLVNRDGSHPNSHSCPGKQLSKDIIMAFMQEFFAAGPWEADSLEKCKVTDLKATVGVLRKVSSGMQLP